MRRIPELESNLHMEVSPPLYFIEIASSLFLATLDRHYLEVST